MQPLRTSLRRALAPRLHRVSRHAAVRIPALVRGQCGGVGRRVRSEAPRRRPQARHEARPDRTASFGHRRVFGGMGADQAEDRPCLSHGDALRAPARASARAARPDVSEGSHLVGLSDCAERVLPARSGNPQAARLRPADRPRAAVRHARDAPGAGRQVYGRRDRGGTRRRGFGLRQSDRAAGVRPPRRPCEGLHAGMGGGDLRRSGRNHPSDRQRISQPCAGRRDDRDRRRDASVPSRRDFARQDRQQRLGRLRMLLGAHAARVLGRRPRSPGRNARHDRAPQPARR